MKQENLELFGITKDELNQSKDILPTLDMGKKLEDESRLVLTFIEDKPKLVNVRDVMSKDKDARRDVPSIGIFLHEVHRPQADGKHLIIPMNEKYNMFLSSKTLRLGIGKIFDSHQENLKDVKVKIHKTKADFKGYGENTCYTVSEIEE